MSDLFDTPPPCGHGRTGGCPFCLARGSDPDTSRKAAVSLDLKITSKHFAMLQLYRAFGPMTDDEAAVRAVDTGLSDRHEQARRVVRTMREKHALLIPAVDADGNTITHTNESGRSAIAYREDTTHD